MAQAHSVDHWTNELNQLIAFAIQLTMKVYSGDKFATWANQWISGEDRSENSAFEAEEDAALDWQRAETLSPEWRAAKAAWEVAWAARLLAMNDMKRAAGTAARAIELAEGIK